MGQPGFVYVMTNPAMPDLVKIGMTTKSPMTRADELSTTGVPAPFEVEFAVYSKDASGLEKECHERFAGCRYRGGREFFRAYADEVAVAILNRLDVLDLYAVISSEEATCISEICCSMNRVSGRDMHALQVLAALEMLTPDELKMLSLRYDAYCDQLQASLDSVESEAES